MCPTFQICWLYSALPPPNRELAVSQNSSQVCSQNQKSRCLLKAWDKTYVEVDLSEQLMGVLLNKLLGRIRRIPLLRSSDDMMYGGLSVLILGMGSHQTVGAFLGRLLVWPTSCCRAQRRHLCSPKLPTNEVTMGCDNSPASAGLYRVTAAH